MPTQVIMPQLGESVVEGLVTKWLKAKGEKVDEFEPLLEVNTDKVDTEVPSPTSGIVLEILVAEGTTVNAGDILAWIGEEGETPPEGIPTPSVIEDPKGEIEIEAVKAFPEPSLAKSPIPGHDRDLGFISPVVAKIAGEYNIDLHLVKGTGSGGRITKKDILSYIETRRKVTPALPTSRPTSPPPSTVSTPGHMPSELLPLTPVRRTIAEHMVLSKHTSPHVTTVMEVDLSRVVAHRQTNKSAFERDGAKLTYTPYFVTAVVAGLKAYPIVNSSWSDEGVVLYDKLNIGVATSLGEEGLIVPVIRNADSLSLLGLTQAVNDLAKRARSRQLNPEEVQLGTFTITNHGVSGSLFATPIINQPQAAILGVGAIQKRVVVISDEILGDTMAIRPMAYLTLTFDHRILDGAIADHFLGVVVGTLHDWK